MIPSEYEQWSVAMDIPVAESRLDGQGLVEIVNLVWDAYLQPEAFLVLPDASPPGGEVITAAISITGGWDGHLRLLCPIGAAGDITARMLDMGPDEITENDIVDAIGEFVNVIGGNVKTRVPQPATLGLPVVAWGKMRFPATRVKHHVAVSWRDEVEPIEFAILEAEERPSHRG
jgi:chemotaxis protein CheX